MQDFMSIEKHTLKNNALLYAVHLAYGILKALRRYYNKTYLSKHSLILGLYTIGGENNKINARKRKKFHVTKKKRKKEKSICVY